MNVDRPAARHLFLTIAGGLVVSTPLARASSPAVPVGHPLSTAQDPAIAARNVYAFDRLSIMGTSFQLLVETESDIEAAACERAVLGEIDRLSSILSTYDDTSEICNVMRGGGVTSTELADILDLYAAWGIRTGGALDVNLGGVKAAWQEAGRNGQMPSDAALADARAKPLSFNVDALGKAFVIDRAVAVARNIVPAGLLNIGGDIRAWGERDWRIDIADPRRPAENAPGIGSFVLRDAAVATSGGYARNFAVGDVRFSHLIDGRTLRPGELLNRSATVVADDCVTANAVATAGCLLDADAAGQLAAEHSRGMLLAGDGAVLATGSLAGASKPGVIAMEAPATKPATKPSNPATKPTAVANGPWVTANDVKIEVVLKTIAAPGGGGAGGGPGGGGPRGGGRGVKRPYVAVWVESADGKPVRTISVWGNNNRWVPDLTTWFKAVGEDFDFAASRTAATKPAGTYSVVWDGKDDSGKAVKQGTYSIRIEINREHGGHVKTETKIVCGTEPATAAVKETAESGKSTITYGPAEAAAK